MEDVAVKLIRVALYARVSTEEQREGQTIDSQISELDRFARDKGWPLIGTYKDEGWSGGLLARPELDRLRDAAGKGLFEAVLVNDVDRLARDVSHLGIIKRDLERCGVQLIFKKLPTETSPTHNLMVNILGSFAEFERELILDRTRRGRRHKVEVRQQFIGGNSPYGFRYIPRNESADKEGYLELMPEEANVVRQMFEWVDKEGISARSVTRRLSSMNVPPRKNGQGWGTSSVLRILRSETYAGVWHYNKFEGCEPMKPNPEVRYRKSTKGSLRKRPKSEWIPVKLSENLTLIERDQWQRVQQQIDRNITFSPRNSKHSYLLKGLVSCGRCGNRYVGDPCHGKYYYRCLARCKQLPTIREERLDSAVWQAVEEAVLNPDLIVAQIEQNEARRATGVKRLKASEKGVEDALSELSVEEARLIEAYRKGVITAEQLSRELEQLGARRSMLETRASELPSQTDAEPLADRKSLLDWCQLVGQRLTEFDHSERQHFLRLLVSEVIFEGNRVRIKCVIREPVPKEVRDPELSLHRENTLFASSRTADLTAYTSGHNPVEIPFEVSRQFPETMTFYEQIDFEWVKARVRENPLVTLGELSQLISQQFGVTPSTSHMLRIQQLAGISRIPGSRVKHVRT